MHYNRLCNIIITSLIILIKLNYTKTDNIIKSIDVEKKLINLNLFGNQTKSNKPIENSIDLQKELEELNNFVDDIKSNQPHSRKKRLIWITDDGRLALPPGTYLHLSPTLALPFIRDPPDGFTSDISINLPVKIDFDKLGLTDKQNPLGDIPPLFARSFGRATGSMLSSYVADYMNFRRFKRDLSNQQQTNNMDLNLDNENKMNKKPSLPIEYEHAFHGGERVLLYGVIEDFLENFGVDGKACVLRAICEVNSKSLNHFGLIGEITKLFLTASNSPFSDHIQEYVEAEEIGKGNISPGECFPYYKKCPKSIFKTFKNNYSKINHNDDDNELNENIIKESGNKVNKNYKENVKHNQNISNQKIVSMKK